MYRCHLCGNLDTADGDESYSTCNSSHGEPCDGCGKLRLLNKQILDAKAALEGLLNQRRELKSKLNLQHKSMIHRLPVEISSLIFEFYVALIAETSVSDTRSWCLVLGAVCRTWRQIAWSSPQLWTHLDIEFEHCITETHIQLVNEWLSRSGRLPLSISLDLESKFNDFPQELLSVFFEGVNNWSSRCYSLFLADCHLLSTRVLDPHGVSILNYLGIESDRMSELEMTTAISGFHFDHSPVDWSNLIVFTASTIFLDEIFDIIQQAPRLMECSVAAVTNRLPLFTDSLVPICHSRIKSITLDCYYGSLEVFLENMSFPSLTYLSIMAFDEELPTQAILSFLTHSSCHLQELSIYDPIITDEELVRVLRATPFLTTLRLCTLRTEPDIPLFYHALSAHLPTTNHRPEKTEPFLPLLEDFFFSGGLHIPWKLIPNFFVSLNETPGAPRRPLTRISIHCNQQVDDPICYISRQSLSQLQDFIDEGVCITLQLQVGNAVASEDFIQLSIKRLEGLEENE